MRQKFPGLILILVTGWVQAGDGVLEINAACRAAGCFSGDDPGAPIRITEPGSYILTSNLSVNVNSTAIVIESDNVTLDLNGFTISGPVSCSGPPAICTQEGLGKGIDGSEADHITIRNGKVRGMGNDGINILSGRVVGVTVTENAGSGLFFGSSLSSQAARIRAILNGKNGIRGGHTSDSNAVGNGNFGITGGTCSNNLMTQNGSGSSCQAILPNQCTGPTNCN